MASINIVMNWAHQEELHEKVIPDMQDKGMVGTEFYWRLKTSIEFTIKDYNNNLMDETWFDVLESKIVKVQGIGRAGAQAIVTLMADRWFGERMIEK